MGGGMEAPDMELIFNGTGTSSGLPLIECVVAPEAQRTCRTCMASSTSSGRRNARRNTSAIVRVQSKDEAPRWLTIVIDAGKTFMASALEWFPKYNLRRIDAVLITHAHADAMNGLDDLRGWTLRGVIQPYVDIYLTKATFTEVSRSFPYLVNKEFGSGGGDLPEFQWHIIEENVPFEIHGISILPFPVQHGRLFTTGATPAASIPTPTTPTAPPLPPPTIERASSELSRAFAQKIMPYMSLGFIIADLLCWISDVSLIPPESWTIVESYLRHKALAVLVVDCLKITPHASHFGIRDSALTAKRLDAHRSYLIGFGHSVPHEDWYEICGSLRNIKGGSDGEHQTSRNPTGLIADGISALEGVQGENAVWLAPSFDGLKLIIKDGKVIEELDPWA